MKRFAFPVSVVLILCCAWLPAAQAVDSEPPFSDPVLQHRYESLIQDFRCLVCFDENIANSNASRAADFRRQVHSMIAGGQSDRQIKSFMVERYGQFVLYSPPLQPNTWLLWAGPFVLLLIGLSVLGFILWRRARMARVEESSP
ncbi:MAG: cytochrome c-type biogenesis protein [Gammaproteobacteria bacterium]